MIVYRELSSLCHDLDFTARMLYTISNSISRHYHTVEIPKKDGGVRVLRVPDQLLMTLQRRIAHRLLANEPISRYAKAYRYGASPLKNALKHTGCQVVMKMDIREFFDHVTFAQVKEMAFPAARYSEANRILLTILCMDEEVLPTGAPTSPFICNIVLRDFDRRLGDWCHRRGISYTRYSDDLTFSGDFDPVPVQEKAAQMLREYGFFPNPRKTVIVRKGQRQLVTGLVVNEKASVPKEKKRKIRQEIYYIRKYGLLPHLARIHEEDAEHYLRSLAGRIAYVLSVDNSEEFWEYRVYVSRLTHIFHEKPDEDTGVYENPGYDY